MNSKNVENLSQFYVADLETFKQLDCFFGNETNMWWCFAIYHFIFYFRLSSCMRDTFVSFFFVRSSFVYQRNKIQICVLFKIGLIPGRHVSEHGLVR